MKLEVAKANLLLFLAAAIWGLAFVSQRMGMEFLGPFTFNGVRFILGSLSLVPLLYYNARQASDAQSKPQYKPGVVTGGILAGSVLFIAASLQQIGLVYTTAGKAAFLTSLYIILVPLLGIFLRHRIGLYSWTGALLAVWGVYLLSVTSQFTIAYGDILELAGALFWAAHILLIDHYSRRVDIVKLAFIQFITCSGLSLGVAIITEQITLSGLRQTVIPLLYGGIASVGIAYTLQIIGQKTAKPSHAAIILSMEAIFAAVGGWILLSEEMSAKGLIGCALMLTGMLLTQVQNNNPDLREGD